MSRVKNSIEDEQLLVAIESFMSNAEELKNSSGPLTENGSEWDLIKFYPS